MFKLKTMIGFYILTIGLGLTLASCEEDDPQPESNTHQDAFGDVFVKKVKTPLGDRYGLIFYAGGQGLITATATEPDNAAYNLAEYWKGPGNMRRHPADNEMQATMPQSGGYIFTLTFEDGETKTLTDTLTDVEIPAVASTTVNYDPEAEEVTVNWNTVEGVDNYMVKLTDKDKNESKPLFVNKTLTIEDNSYTFNKKTSASPGWLQSGVPVAGDTCYVMLVAVKYEEGVSSMEKDQNKQMNTVKPTMIIW